MAKAKKNTKRITDTQRVVAEIDANKLAEAIILAEDLRRKRDEENLENAEERPSNVWMKTILTIVLFGVAVITVIAAVGCIWYGGLEAYLAFRSNLGESWRELVNGAILILIGLLLAVVSFFTILTEREISSETNTHYIASMFSNVVALAALIIALVALIKG